MESIGITHDCSIFIIEKEKFKGQPTQISKNNSNMNYINNNTTGNQQYANNSAYFVNPIPEAVPTSKIVNEQQTNVVNLDILNIQPDPKNDSNIEMNLHKYNKNGKDTGMIESVNTNPNFFNSLTV